MIFKDKLDYAIRMTEVKISIECYLENFRPSIIFNNIWVNILKDSDDPPSPSQVIHEKYEWGPIIIPKDKAKIITQHLENLSCEGYIKSGGCVEF